MDAAVVKMEAPLNYENGLAVEKDLDDSAEPHNSKRMRCELQNNNNLDTKHSINERLWKIFEREINKEIEERMTSLETIEKRIAQCHSDLHLLRKGVVKKYYENTYKKCTGKVQHRIHPAVSKLIGKRPRQNTDLVENVESLAENSLCDRKRITRFSTIKRKETFKDGKEKILPEKQKHVSENMGKLPRYVPPKLPETCNSQDSLRAGNTQKYRMRVCIGNLAKKVNDSIYDKATHKWVLYVRSSIGSLNIEQEVSKVRFFLHPSYKPHDVVTVPSPPFVLHRRGWGEFPVRIRLCFSNSLNKNVDIIHNLQLHGSNWGSIIKSTETFVDLWLHSVHVKKDEDEPERISEGTFEHTAKNLKTDITLCNANCQHTNSLDEKCMACKLDDANFENYKSENESGLGSDSETCSNELNKYLPEECVSDKINTVQYGNSGGMNCLKQTCSFANNISSHQIDNMYSSDISEHDHVQDTELENDLDNIINFDLDYGDTDLHKSLLLDNVVEEESENIFMIRTSEDKNDLLVNTLLNGDFSEEFHLPRITQNKECKDKGQMYTASVDNELEAYSSNNEDDWLKFDHKKDGISPQHVEELEHYEYKNNFKIKNVEKVDASCDAKEGGNKSTEIRLNTQNSLEGLVSTERHALEVENFNIKTESEEISCNNSVQATEIRLNTQNSLEGLVSTERHALEIENFNIKTESEEISCNNSVQATEIRLNTQNSLEGLVSTERHALEIENFNIKTESEEISCNNSVQGSADLLLNISSSCLSNNNEDKIIRNGNSSSNNGVTLNGQCEMFDDVFDNWVEEIVIESGTNEDYKIRNQCPNADGLNHGILSGSEEFLLPNNYFCTRGEKQSEQPFHNENMNMNINDYDNLISNGSDVEYLEEGSEINSVENTNTINNVLIPLHKKVFIDSSNKEETMNNGSVEQKRISDNKNKNNVMNLLSSVNSTILESDRYLHNIGDRVNNGLVKVNAPKIEYMKQSEDSWLLHNNNSFSNNDVTLKQPTFKQEGRIFIKNKRTKFKRMHLDSKHHPIRIHADSSIDASSIGSKQLVFLSSKKVLDKNVKLCSEVNSSQIGSNSIALTDTEISSGLSQVLPENRTCTSLNGDKLELNNKINTTSDVTVVPSILQRNSLHINSRNNNKIPVSKLNNFIIVNKNRVQPQVRPVISPNSKNNRYILVPASDSSKVNKHLVIQKSPVFQSSVVNSSTKHILISTSASNTKDGRLIVVKPPGVSLLKNKQQQHTTIKNPQTVTQNHQLTVSSCIEHTGFRDNKTLLLNKKLSKEIITETRIAQLYKCRDNLVNNCKFADIEAAVRWLVRGLPLVHVDACFLPFKALHPYCAPDTETFISWPRPKQHAAEWLRAKTVQRILKSKGMQNIWSTKQIMYWSRHHGYCPTYKLQDDLKGETRNNRDNIFIHKLTQYIPATVELHWADSNTESTMDTTYIDVVGVSDSLHETRIHGSKGEIIENEDLVDNSEWGRNFHILIKSRIKQMCYGIKQEVPEGRLHHSGAALLLISQTTHILAEDLLRRSLAAAHQREGTSVELEDTHAALLSRPEFDLFTNQGLGIID